jgi:hypothetical protein
LSLLLSASASGSLLRCQRHGPGAEELGAISGASPGARELGNRARRQFKVDRFVSASVVEQFSLDLQYDTGNDIS